jgi:hypothetical protein
VSTRRLGNMGGPDGRHPSRRSVVIDGHHQRMRDEEHRPWRGFHQRPRDRIDASDPEELRELITAHAAALDPAARVPFLAVFDGSRSGDAEPGDDSLTADVADLERLREGEYFDGWG